MKRGREEDRGGVDRHNTNISLCIGMPMATLSFVAETRQFFKSKYAPPPSPCSFPPPSSATSSLLFPLLLLSSLPPSLSSQNWRGRLRYASRRSFLRSHDCGCQGLYGSMDPLPPLPFPPSLPLSLSSPPKKEN